MATEQGAAIFTLEAGAAAKRHAPATLRNRDAIAEALADILPPTGLVVEIASGTGEHVVHFAGRFPDLIWQPSDHDAIGLESIAAWSAAAGQPNIVPPVQIDAAAAAWPLQAADAIFCANMVHIAPWSAAEGLFAGAGRVLAASAPLVLYGPFIEQDFVTAPSNAEFDASLRARNPEWGIRDLAALDALAAAHGLSRCRRVAMPANNLLLVWRKD